MATTTENIVFDTTINVGNSGNSIKSVRAELRQLNQELAGLDSGSPRFVEAAKRAGELKDRIGDVRNTIDAFNPEAKFKAFANVVGIAANGFSALQGAMAIFGSESKDLTRIMAQTQGAIALATGLNGLMGMGDAFKDLKLFAGDALKSIRAGIGATGIGLLVVAVGVLAANWDSITKAIKTSFPIFNDIGKIIEKIRETAYGVGEVLKSSILAPFKAIAKAISGDFSGAVEELKKGYDLVGNFKKGAEAGIKANEEIAEQERLDRLIKQREKEIEILRANGKEVYKEELALNKLKQTAAKDNQTELDKLRQEEKVIIATHNKNLKELEKQKNLKIQAEKKAELTFELEQLKAKGTRTVLELEEQQKIEKKILDTDLKNKVITQNEYNRQLEQLEINKDKFIKDREKGRQDSLKLARQEQQENINQTNEQIANDELESAEERFKALDALNKQGLLSDQQTADAKIKITQNENNAKLQLLDSFAGSLTTISGLVGKDTVEGKALAIASATISTYTAIAKTLAANAANTPLAIASSVAIGLTGFAAVKNIIDTPIPGNSGGGGGSQPSFSAPPIPQIPQSVSGTRLNQTDPLRTINEGRDSKVFVTETDITKTQNKVKNIIKKATIK